MESMRSRQITKFPLWGQIKLENGYVIKYSLYSDDEDEKRNVEWKIIDCVPYVSRSRLTFSGCYKFNNKKIIQKGGLVKVRSPYLVIKSERKLTTDKEEMTKLIEDYLNKYINDREFGDVLIVYDNYKMEFYLRKDWKHAPVFLPERVYRYGILSIYKLPSETIVDLQSTPELNISYCDTTIKIEGNLKAKELPTFNKGIVAYLLSSNDGVKIEYQGTDGTVERRDQISPGLLIVVVGDRR